MFSRQTTRLIRIASVASALLALAPPGLAAHQEAKGSGTVVIHAARVIVGTGATPILNGVVVVVTDDKIVAVGTETSVMIPAGARRVDLGDATPLPGFIDAHVHLVGRELNDPGAETEATKDSPGFTAILSVANARKTLMAGFTTVRNVGAPNFDDVSLRHAIEGGHVPGPRMRTAPRESRSQRVRASRASSTARSSTTKARNSWPSITPISFRRTARAKRWRRP